MKHIITFNSKLKIILPMGEVVRLSEPLITVNSLRYNSISSASFSEKSDMLDSLSELTFSCPRNASSVAYFRTYSEKWKLRSTTFDIVETMIGTFEGINFDKTNKSKIGIKEINICDALNVWMSYFTHCRKMSLTVQFILKVYFLFFLMYII